jgi:hypothetical protein
MTGDSRVTMHKGAAALIAVFLLLAGAGASYPKRAFSSGTTSWGPEIVAISGSTRSVVIVKSAGSSAK